MHTVDSLAPERNPKSPRPFVPFTKGVRTTADRMSIPLAHVFELGGDTIWAPAVLHFVVQSVPKVVTFENAEAAASFPLWWMASSGLLPMSALLVSRGQARTC